MKLQPKRLGCLPHCCPYKNVLLTINLRSGSLLALFWNGSNEMTECFSSGASMLNIPAEIKEQYLEMHISRMNANDQLLPKNKWMDAVRCQ